MAGCQSQPNYYNLPLAPGASNARTAITPPGDPNDPIIILAFSGGGARAAALSLSVLDELAAYNFRRADGSSGRLIDQVRIVSSVSGGSVTAAWFGLNGPQDMEKLNKLRDNFLVKDNMGTLIWKAADPVTWVRLAFTRYTRIDAFADLLDQRLFDKKTFKDINQPGKARIILNATDMSSGEVFSFIPERFDDICSDLDSLKISNGVAASAAFPVAFSPYSLKDFHSKEVGKCQGAIPADAWIKNALGLGATSQSTRYIDLEEFKRARYAAALRNEAGAYREISYLHLLDGGLADNQGGHAVQGLLYPHSSTRLLFDINRDPPIARRVVIIAVNARSDPDDSLSKSPDVPGLFDAINAVKGIPIDSTTAYANAGVQLLVDQLNSIRTAQEKAGDKNPLRVYGISVDFDQFRNDQADLRDRLKAIGTSWNLNAEQLQMTMDAGGTLLRQHPCFQHLLMDVHAPAPFIDQNFVATACRLEGDPQP